MKPEIFGRSVNRARKHPKDKNMLNHGGLPEVGTDTEALLLLSAFLSTSRQSLRCFQG